MTHRNWSTCLTPPLVAAILLAAGCHRPELPTQPPRLVDTAAKADAPAPAATPGG